MKRESLRVVFFGMDSWVGRWSLEAVAGRFEVVGVVEPQFQARGLRARLLKRESALAGWARRHGVPHRVMASKDDPGILEFLEALVPDVGCVASFSKLLPARVLDIPRHGFLNVHGSLLPLLRGPNPLFWAYYSMACEHGTTIHRLDPGEDTGEIVKQVSFPLPLGADPAVIQARVDRAGAEMLVAALEDLAAGRLEGMPQRHLPCPLRARRVRPDEALIDWSDWPIERVYHVLQGCRRGGPPLPRLGRLTFRPAAIERAPVGAAPGTLLYDIRGPYLAHAQGKIRLWPALFG